MRTWGKGFVGTVTGLAVVLAACAGVSTSASARALPHVWKNAKIRRLHAEYANDEKYLTIVGEPRVQVSEEPLTPSQIRAWGLMGLQASPATFDGVADGVGIDINTIVNLGKSLWSIIESNRPVVNVQTDTASALPKGALGWQDLQGWKVPTAKVYRYTYENAYGMDVVDFAYRVIYAYGGSVRGQGRYLANVTVMPADLSVSWGYKFNAKASVPSVLNAGTTDDPIASAQLLIDWSIDTVFKHLQSTQVYYVRGDGDFQDLSMGN